MTKNQDPIERDPESDVGDAASIEDAVQQGVCPSCGTALDTDGECVNPACPESLMYIDEELDEDDLDDSDED